MPYDDRRPPEPADLHAALSATYPLDWGSPLPTRADLVSTHGRQAATASLAMIVDAVGREHGVTEAVLASVPPGSVAHQLECRVKSPQSLARKLGLSLRAKQTLTEPEDVLRFTVLLGSANGFVDSARHAVDALRRCTWTVVAARNSYVDRSRYKGLHVYFGDPAGKPVEVQVHTKASIAVKKATTSLYAIERDRSRPVHERDAARAECVRLSDALETPPGLDGLATLGGVRVDVHGYGLPSNDRQRRGGARAAERPFTERGDSARQRTANERIDR